MRPSTRARVVWLGALVLLAAPGCSGRERFEFAQVEGVVTLRAKPLSGVMVSFYPDNDGPKQLPYATGVTDSNGKYTLATPSGTLGALVGKNRVVINWPLPERREDGARTPPPGPPIPLPYTTVTQTPLIVEVKAGAPQNIDLPLK
jgi:hypothetical protein